MQFWFLTTQAKQTKQKQKRDERGLVISILQAFKLKTRTKQERNETKKAKHKNYQLTKRINIFEKQNKTESYFVVTFKQ